MTKQEYINLAEQYEQQLTVIEEKIRQKILQRKIKGLNNKQLNRSIELLEKMRIECSSTARKLRKEAEEAIS